MSFPWIGLPLAATLAVISVGLAQEGGPTDADPDEALRQAMERLLLSGDKSAVDEVVAFGPQAFDVLAQELRHPKNYTTQYHALCAFLELPDKRVFIFVMEGNIAEAESYGAYPWGWSEGRMLGYIKRTMWALGVSVYECDDLLGWYRANEHRLVWDPVSECFRIAEQKPRDEVTASSVWSRSLGVRPPLRRLRCACQRFRERRLGR